ncbi:MAG: preprotein translocase subunit YajC [Planctomycetota bacterium]
MKNSWILAQSDAVSTTPAEPITEETSTTTAVTADQNAPASPPAKGPLPMQWIFILLMVVVFYFLIFRGPRKKQQQQKQMVQSLQKNDRVRTIGGIIGTVIDVKDDEITIKVDESNNTKIKVVAGAISTKLSEETK